MYNLNNFTGIDADPEISLFEYGIIWQKNKECDPGELFCILRVPTRERFLYVTGYFDQSDLDWIDMDDILSFTGLTAEQWEKEPLGQKIHAVISYYGAHNLATPYNGLTEKQFKERVTA